MINLKSADRIKVRTFLGSREVKAELYKGFGINKDIYDNSWILTVLTGTRKGIGIVQCRNKKNCRIVADEIIKRINKIDIEDSDIDSIRDIVKKYSI